MAQPEPPSSTPAMERTVTVRSSKEPVPHDSSRSKMRMLKQKILEQEQAAEDREALKMTEEQRDMLIDSFRAVKMEFNDLDGLSWSAPSARRLLQQWYQQHANLCNPFLDFGAKLSRACSRRSLGCPPSPTPAPRDAQRPSTIEDTARPPSRHRHTTPVDPSFFLLDDQTSDPAELDTPCPSPKTRRTLAAPPLPTVPNIPPAPPNPSITPAHADDNNLLPAALNDDSAPSSKAYPVLDTCLPQHVLAELPIPPPLVRTSCIRIPSSESLAHRKTSPAGARKVSPAAARKTPPSTLRRAPSSPSARRASPAGARNLSPSMLANMSLVLRKASPDVCPNESHCKMARTKGAMPVGRPETMQENCDVGGGRC